MDEKIKTVEKVTKGTILVLEDSDPARNVVTLFLEKNNYKVIGFSNGEAALEYIQQEEISDLKLILSDIMMPKVDGFEFIRKIKELGKFVGIPILIMSAMTEKESVIEAKSLGVTGYILKPISIKKLSDVLKKLFPNETFKDISQKFNV